MIRVLTLIATMALDPQGVQAVATQQGQELTQTAARESTVRKLLNLQLENVTVEQALREIAAQAGMQLFYNAGTVSLSSKTTVRLKNAPVQSALASATRGTGVVAMVGPDGATIMVSKAGATTLRKAQGVITGTITDTKSGKPIAGSNVSLNSGGQATVTGEDGTYRLTGIAPGTYTVSVRLVGYAKQTRTVTVGEGATVTANFKLEPSANVLDQVIVTGTVVQTELKAVPSAITVITAKQIEERGITRIDQLFRGDIPGLFSMNRGSSAALDEVTMFSRGATALSAFGSAGVDGLTGVTNVIKTYVDGVELADSKYLSQIDPSSIERIEILTGPQASTIYGSNALNGVMQIFTKRGTNGRPQVVFNLTSSVAQNNFNSSLTTAHITDGRVSGTEGRWSYNVGGSWNYLGSWTPGKRTQRVSVNGGGRMDMGKFIADVSVRQGLTKNLQKGSQQQTRMNLRNTGVWQYNNFDQVPQPLAQSLVGRTVGLSVSYRPLSWWSHSAVLGSANDNYESIQTYVRYLVPIDSGMEISAQSTSRTSQQYSTTMQFPLSASAGLNLTLGADHWQTRGSSWSASPPVSTTGNLASVNGVTRNKPDKNVGAYVQGQLGLLDALFLTFGARVDHNPNFGDKAKVRPSRYGLSYTRAFNDVSVKVRGSYGRSIRPPGNGLAGAVVQTNAKLVGQFGLYNAQLANSDLGAEFQQGSEGGVELYFGSRTSLTITRYNQTVDNLIEQILKIDSVPSLMAVAPVTTNCLFNSAGGFTFDDQGRCFAYQNKYLNVGSIRNQGWELQGSINTGPFTTRGTYSWTKSRVIGVTPKYKSLLTGSIYQPGRSFNYLPEHTYALGVTYSQSSNTVALSVNGTGMLYKQDDGLSLRMLSGRLTANQPRVGRVSGYRALSSGYTTADLNASHRFSSRMDAILQVNNLTNYYRNDFDDSNVTLGRQSRAGVRIKL